MANRSKTFSSERKLLPSQNKHATELYTVRKVKLLKTSEKKITKINEKGNRRERDRHLQSLRGTSTIRWKSERCSAWITMTPRNQVNNKMPERHPKQWKNYTNIHSIWNPNQSEWCIIFWKVTLIQSTLGNSHYLSPEWGGGGGVIFWGGGENTWSSEGASRR